MPGRKVRVHSQHFQLPTYVFTAHDVITATGPSSIMLDIRNMTLIPYNNKFRQTCVEICNSNVPSYFTESDVVEFANFIDSTSDPYYVLEDSGNIIGCGGIYLKGKGIAALSWGMIHSGSQGK